MAFSLSLVDDEKVYFKCIHHPDRNSPPLAVAVTSKAIYIPKRKTLAIGNDYYWEKWNKEDVIDWQITTANASVMKLIGVGAIFFGVALPVLLYVYAWTDNIRLVVTPILLILFGIAVLRNANRRFIFTATKLDTAFSWKYPIAIPAKRRATLNNLFRQLRDALIKAKFQHDTPIGN